MGLDNFINFLSSGADAAIILFAYFLWKMDRRLLIVELEVKSLVNSSPREDDE